MKYKWFGAVTSPTTSASSQGVAWTDFDGDGDVDVYVAHSPGGNQLLRNDAGTFVDATSAPLNDAGYGTGVAWGDADNDGDPDLYLVNNGSANKLFRNDGNGSFTDITPSLLADTGNGASVSWVDFDRDGLLDLYVVNNGSANKLFRNLGCNGWADSSAMGVGDTGSGAGCAWGDYDGDHDPDVYLVNSGANKLLRNDGSSFTDVTSGPLGNTGNGRGAVWADFDRDGDQDLFLVDPAGNKLLRNDAGSFVDATPTAVVGNGDGEGVAVADYDNDGWLDLYLTNDGTNQLFRGLGSLGFEETTFLPLDSSKPSLGVAWADFDTDGEQDLYVATTDTNTVYRREVSCGNHWLQVIPQGTVSNRSGIGARVRVVTGTTSQVWVVDGGSGYRSQGPQLASFGLGSATVVDTLEVRWPSDSVRTQVSVAVDQRLLVSEPGTSAVVSSTMAGWSSSGPNPNQMTLHFGFDTTRWVEDVEVAYWVFGTTDTTTVSCGSAGATCTFGCDLTQEITTTYGGCQTTKFGWRARAKNPNGWSSSWSATKTFTAYCLQGP